MRGNFALAMLASSAGAAYAVELGNGHAYGFPSLPVGTTFYTGETVTLCAEKSATTAPQPRAFAAFDNRTYYSINAYTATLVK